MSVVPMMYFEPEDVYKRLAELDLTQDALWSAVQEGFVARQSCTQLDPPAYRGLTAWAVTTRALRKRLVPMGWTMSNSENYARTVSPRGTTSIVVATGDSATGRNLPDIQPRTSSEKGPQTLAAVALNRIQFDLFARDDFKVAGTTTAMATWILLIAFDGAAIQAELSLPAHADETSHIDTWNERILLSGADGNDLPLRLPKPGPDFDIDVSRKLG